MIRKLWRRFDIAMIGYWVPTFITIMSFVCVFGFGYFVDKCFYWFGCLFGPLVVALWWSIWRWEHPKPRYGSMGLPYDDWPPDRGWN
jgi:hypothetical protein